MPLGFEALNELPFLLGAHPAKAGVALGDLAPIGIFGEGAGIGPEVRALHPGLLGDARHGHRVVAADDLYGHALLAEIAQGFGRAGAQLILQKHQPQGAQAARQRGCGGQRAACGQKQGAAALPEFSIQLGLAEQRPGQNHFRRAQH